MKICRFMGLVFVIVVLAGCSQLPVQKQDFAGGIYDQGPAEFAVFAEAGKAMAVQMGDGKTEAEMESFAIQAIERATGCHVVLGSLQGDAKTIEAEIACTGQKVGKAPSGAGPAL